MTGKIEEIKDFMFTIESDKGTYAMTFDTAPEGLSDVKEGDEVTVTYTGECSAKWMRLQEPLFLWRKQINVMRKR